MSDQRVSGWALGWTTFAALVLGFAGMFQIIDGIAAIAGDELHAVTTNWTFSFDLTTWGWIHLVLGIVLVLSGFGVLSGNLAARTVGVLVAALSAIASFASLPYYPIWAIVIIAVDIAVIWALTVHGHEFDRAP